MGEIKFKYNIEGQIKVLSVKEFHNDNKHEVITAIVETQAKYPNVVVFGSNNNCPFIALKATLDELYISNIEKKITEIVFPELEGWEIYTYSKEIYRVGIIFVKNREKS